LPGVPIVLWRGDGLFPKEGERHHRHAAGSRLKRRETRGPFLTMGLVIPASRRNSHPMVARVGPPLRPQQCPDWVVDHPGRWRLGFDLITTNRVGTNPIPACFVDHAHGTRARLCEFPDRPGIESLALRAGGFCKSSMATHTGSFLGSIHQQHRAPTLNCRSRSLIETRGCYVTPWPRSFCGPLRAGALFGHFIMGSNGLQSLDRKLVVVGAGDLDKACEQ
jgi:hypothetical protein